MSLNAAAIFAVNDTPLQQLEVPEWGGAICIRSLTGKEWDEINLERESLRKKPSDGHYAAHVCVRGIVDDLGKNCFAVADVPKLAAKNVTVLQKVAIAILNLSGTSTQAREDIEKN